MRTPSLRYWPKPARWVSSAARASPTRVYPRHDWLILARNLGNPAHGETICLRYGTARADEGERALRENARLTEAETVAQRAELKGSRMVEGEFIRRLGEAAYGRNNGRVGILGLLACADLLLHEGLALTPRAHEEFLRTSGALRDIRAVTKRGEDARQRAEVIRSRCASYPVEGGLNRAICEALIELNARSVLVLSADFARGGLKSIPEVKDAVRDAWLTMSGLEKQVQAAASGEDLPSWPVLIQREPPSTRGGPSPAWRTSDTLVRTSCSSQPIQQNGQE